MPTWVSPVFWSVTGSRRRTVPSGCSTLRKSSLASSVTVIMHFSFPHRLHKGFNASDRREWFGACSFDYQAIRSAPDLNRRPQPPVRTRLHGPGIVTPTPPPPRYPLGRQIDRGRGGAAKILCRAEVSDYSFSACRQVPRALHSFPTRRSSNTTVGQLS